MRLGGRLAVLGFVATLGVLGQGAAAAQIVLDPPAPPVQVAPPPPKPPVPKPPIPTPRPVTMPAGIISSVIGYVLPEAGGAAVAGLSIDNGKFGGINTTNGITTGLSLMNWVPGFSVGYKTGTWIAAATGLYPGEGLPPDPAFVPYKDLVANPIVGFVMIPGQGQNSVYPPYPGGVNWANVWMEVNDRIWVYGQTVTISNPSVTNGAAGVAIHFTKKTDQGANYMGVPSWNHKVYCRNDPGSVAGGPSMGQNYTEGTRQIGNHTFWSTFYRGTPDTFEWCKGAGGFDHMEGFAPDGFNGGYLKWYPPGHQLRPPDPPKARPDRVLRSTRHCKAANGGQNSSTALSAPFKEDGGLIPPPPIAPECAPGTFESGSDIEMIDAGSPYGPALKNVHSYRMPAEAQTWFTENPNCWEGNCPVDIKRVDTTTGTKVSCFTDPRGCEDWATDPQREQKYECAQNGRVLSVDQCRMYAPSFKPELVNQGALYADPRTGTITVPQQQPQPAPNPLPAPNPAPAAPWTGVPEPAPAPAPAPAPQPQTHSCFPSGWGLFNPVEWVLKPILCAFMPDPTHVQTQVRETLAVVRTTPPISYVFATVAQIPPMVTTVLGGKCNGSIANFGDGIQIPCQPPPAIKPYIDALKAIIVLAISVMLGFHIWAFVEESMKE